MSSPFLIGECNDNKESINHDDAMCGSGVVGIGSLNTTKPI